MNSKKEPGMDIAEEFLTDVAGNFFEARRRLETMIDAFEASLDRLGREAARVGKAAAGLECVTLGPDGARELFERLGVDAAPFAAAARRAGEPDRLPRPEGLGRRSRYASVVQDAYRRLATAVRRYREGPPEGEDRQEEAVYYNLVAEMARLVNRRVEEVNAGFSPSCLLNYVKQFNPRQVAAETITGGGAGSPNGAFDRNLCFRPVRLDTDRAPQFPSLPPADRVRRSLAATAEAIHRCRPQEIRRLLATLRVQPSRG